MPFSLHHQLGKHLFNMSSETPLLVVLGATGNQGGSVVSYFLSLPDAPYAIRGVTRDPSSSKSTALASRGVEMVAGDFDDPSSLDAAFKGASVIFTVSDYWATFFSPAVREKAAASGESHGVLSREIETQQNKNIIDAAARVGTLERFIFSSLANTAKLSGGKYPYVYHFDGKALAEKYGRTAHPKLWEKTNVFFAGMYLENFFSPATSSLRPKLVSLFQT
jgi:nucleoside-diphosphate-sugar epimerase